MRIDRVAEDIHVFISGIYAQVTATVLTTPAGAIVVDTLPLPIESREIVSFIEDQLGPNSVRYVVYTHHHADHVYGAYLFPEAEVIAHDRCRRILATAGQASLQRARRETPALAEVSLRLPDITFDEEMSLHLAHRSLNLFHTPGISPDGISVMVADEKVLIAGDTVMPIPHIVRGDYEQLIETFERIKALQPNFVVQGHGDVLLKGEVNESIDSSIAYLHAIVERVQDLVRQGAPPKKLKEIDIEECGKSRIPLDGLVSRLHLDNLVALYRTFRQS
ncbi:MAG TPA: MBL fold metallo-hydrolase [Chloroflexi bacterium]|nr:MBL fold metallo-hydrolase [Chloroflexota bacterium]